MKHKPGARLAVALVAIFLAGCIGRQASRTLNENEVGVGALPRSVRTFAKLADFPAPHFTELEFMTMDERSERTRVTRLDTEQGLSTVSWCTDREDQLSCGRAVDLGCVLRLSQFTRTRTRDPHRKVQWRSSLTQAREATLTSGTLNPARMSDRSEILLMHQSETTGAGHEALGGPFLVRHLFSRRAVYSGYMESSPPIPGKVYVIRHDALTAGGEVLHREIHFAENLGWCVRIRDLDNRGEVIGEKRLIKWR